MAELSLRQIEDRLNAEFAGDTRKLIFWYDDNGGFAEDIDSLHLTGAKVYHLQPDNQFYTKYFLERVDTTTNYLIYAPFPKPDIADNHLEDTLLYSKRFFADRTALLCADLGIREDCRRLFEKYSGLFGQKEFVQRFCDLGIDTYTEETIQTGLLCAACKTRTCSFDEVVCALLTAGELTGNPLLAELEQCGLAEIFWQFCERQFGYADVTPSLERLVVTLYVTSAYKCIPSELPKAWKPFVSYKAGSSISFLDGMSNSILYRERYDELSDYVAAGLKAGQALADYPAEELLDCDTFRAVDGILVKWLTGRLLAEDTGARLNGLAIPEICEKRIKMHFGGENKSVFLLMENAYTLIASAAYTCPNGLRAIVKQYQDTGCRLDQAYRKFYLYYDQIEDSEGFELLRELVENIYTNEYLAEQLPKWNAALAEPDSLELLPLQRNFYARNIRTADVRTVVIISDAMRYEVGRELFARMQDDPKCTARLDVMLGVLPSYTQLGMAALLPHRTLEMTDDFRVLTDGILGADLAARQRILQGRCPQSACVQLDEIKSMKVAGLREIFTGKQVVYVYQNQIDAHGDEPPTEDEVFTACEQAMDEIVKLIRRLSVSANTVHFIVTAAHGFLYQRGNRAESDKITGVKEAEAFCSRRFHVSRKPVAGQGIQNLSMGRLLGNGDEKFVSFPVGNSVFKLPGGGQNYVHGGSSPQEMLIPVLKIKMEKGHVETHPAQITLVSILRKVTNLITMLDFLQSEPVSDVVKEAAYKVFFVSEQNERISNENTYVADSREPETQKRIFRMRFTFKNRKYDRDTQYYLVACDTVTGLEIFRYPVTMDLAFTDDFGFGG